MLTTEQKARRLLGIGGSEISAVVGLDPYRTSLDVWLGKSEGWETPVTGPMERGIFLEDGVARWYAHRTGAALEEPGTLQHPARPLVICTPDRIATASRAPDPDEEWAGERVEHRLLSIKVPGPYVREQWGDEWTEDVPQGHLLQIQWEFAVLDGLDAAQDRAGSSVEEIAHLAAPIDGDLRIYKIRRDRELGAMLMDEAERWWRDYVVTGKPPPIDGSSSCSDWLKRRFPRSNLPLLQASPDVEVLALELQEAEARAEEAAADEERAKNRLKDVIGEAEGVQGAFGRITWKSDKNGKRSFKKTWRKQ